MRLSHLVAAAALLTASLTAHAASITQQLTLANGDATVRSNRGVYLVETNSFMDFNPSQGTLNSVTFTFMGNASYTAGGSGHDFIGVIYKGRNPPGQITEDLTRPGTLTFTENANISDSFGLALFSGIGTAPLSLEFIQPTTDVNIISGSITYNYTAAVVPPVAVTPEPSSLALFGTGFLGVAGVLRKRFA